MSESDRLRERAHQIDMAQNGLSLPWAKKHLSPLLRESADRIEALEDLVRDMWVKNIGRMDTCGYCVMGCGEEERCDFERRMRELGVM